MDYGSGHGHSASIALLDDEEPVKAFDPGSILVAAAVMVAFEIVR